jgi:hypothetical protein
MKNIISVIVLLLLALNVKAQSYGIIEEVDEFTFDTILKTDWLVLNDPVWRGGRIAYMKISRMNNQLILHFKTTTAETVLSVNKDDFLYIKLENENILKLNNLEHTVSGSGAGAINLRGSKTQGISLLFLITEEQLKSLTESKVSKVRLVTSSGNLEIEPEKDKYKQELQTYFKYFERYISRN